jgi:hypothetical protein
MTRDQVEKEIADRELLASILRATEDMESMQRDPELRGPVDIFANDAKGGASVTTLRALPPAIALAMFRAASAALEEQLQMEKV